MIDIRKSGSKHWKEVIPQRDETLRGVGLVGNTFVDAAAVQLYARAAADAVLEGKAAAPNVASVREEEFSEADGDGAKSARRAPAKKAPPKRASAKDDGVAPAKADDAALEAKAATEVPEAKEAAAEAEAKAEAPAEDKAAE